MTCLSCAAWTQFRPGAIQAAARRVGSLPSNAGPPDAAPPRVAPPAAAPPNVATPDGALPDVAPPIAIGVAGGSALREYQRRHDARERRARERAGTVGVWLARLSGDPSSTRRWRQGGEGETKVGKRLTQLLAGSGVYLLHDRLVPGRRHANIDHIAIGPGGVTVIDAKALVGKVRVGSRATLFGPSRTKLLVKGRDRTQLVYAVRGQAEAVRGLLERQGITCDVRAALCFADTGGLPLMRRLEVEQVTIDGTRRVAKLAKRPGCCDREQVMRIVRLLATGLRSA